MREPITLRYGGENRVVERAVRTGGQVVRAAYAGCCYGRNRTRPGRRRYTRSGELAGTRAVRAARRRNSGGPHAGARNASARGELNQNSEVQHPVAQAKAHGAVRVEPERRRR